MKKGPFQQSKCSNIDWALNNSAGAKFTQSGFKWTVKINSPHKIISNSAFIRIYTNTIIFHTFDTTTYETQLLI